MSESILWRKKCFSLPAKLTVIATMALLYLSRVDQTIQPLKSSAPNLYDHAVKAGNHSHPLNSSVHVPRLDNILSKENQHIANWTVQSNETRHPTTSTMPTNLTQNHTNWTLPNSFAPTRPGNNTSLGRNTTSLAITSVPSRPDDSSVPQPPEQHHYTPAQRCRLGIQEWLNPLIDQFLEMGEAMPPLLDWVWDMGDSFLINMRFNDYFSWNQDAFLGATWNWQDQFGNNFTIDRILGNFGRRHVPLLMIQSRPWNETNQTEQSKPVFLWASNVKVPPNKTVQEWTYDLRPFLKCDRIEVEDDRPRPGTKIGMCVRFRGGHHLIPPFIAYHRLIGVEHFWFFANEEFNITDLPQAADVTYVPYRYVWSEHINHSRAEGENGEVKPWRLPFGGNNFWQVQAMQQCLYRVKRYGLEWLMTNDVDEYLWVNKTESSKPYTVNISVVQDFLQPYENQTDLGALAVEGWAFGVNDSYSEILEFPIDYVYRAQEMTGGRRKLIYRVPMSQRIDVHWLRGGGRTIALPPSDIRWNHYRRPQDGIFQRGKRPIVMDSSLRDTYRAAMVESMKNDTYLSSL